MFVGKLQQELVELPLELIDAGIEWRFDFRGQRVAWLRCHLRRGCHGGPNAKGWYLAFQLLLQSLRASAYLSQFLLGACQALGCLAEASAWLPGAAVRPACAARR